LVNAPHPNVSTIPGQTSPNIAYPGRHAINEINNFIIETTFNPNFLAINPGHNHAPNAF
jgi:hypothetical protein